MRSGVAPARSVLFLGRSDEGSHRCRDALALARTLFAEVTAFLGDWGEPFPAAAGAWSGDLVLSYLSRWVVPPPVLKRARAAALNFHPASPEYPGVCGTNFALYDGAREFGATCHHMAAKVDTGPIIAVERFPVLASDDVASLIGRSHAALFALFEKITALLALGEPLPSSAERWARAPYTRRDFDALCTLTTDMSREELERRIRATSYGPWKPTLDVNGVTFVPRSPGDRTQSPRRP